MNTQIDYKEIDNGWHKDFHLDDLKPSAIPLAMEVRQYLQEQLGGLQSDEFDGHASGCKLFQPKVGYVYSTGGYYDDDVQYHTGECKGEFSMIFDGGILYDFLSIEGAWAHLSHRSFWNFRESIERIASKHGCMVEDSTRYSMTFYKED